MLGVAGMAELSFIVIDGRLLAPAVHDDRDSMLCCYLQSTLHVLHSSYVMPQASSRLASESAGLHSSGICQGPDLCAACRVLHSLKPPVPQANGACLAVCGCLGSVSVDAMQTAYPLQTPHLGECRDHADVLPTSLPFSAQSDMQLELEDVSNEYNLMLQELTDWKHAYRTCLVPKQVRWPTAASHVVLHTTLAFAEAVQTIDKVLHS